MTRRLLTAAAVIGVLAMAALVPLALSQDLDQTVPQKKCAQVKKPASGCAEAMEAGCAMGAKAAADMKGCGMGAEKPAQAAAGRKGCAMGAAPATAKAGCAMHGVDAKGCAMKGAGMAGGKGCCDMKGAAAKGCGMGAGMAGGKGCCDMMAAMEPGMCGPGMGRGPMGPGMGACGPMGPGARGLGMGLGPGPEMARALGLSEDQRQKIVGIRDRFTRLAIEKQAEIRVAALDMRELGRAAAPDRAKLDAQVDKIARLRTELAKARVGAMLEMRAVLTPEQLQKWQDRPMGAGGPTSGGEGIGG